MKYASNLFKDVGNFGKRLYRNSVLCGLSIAMLAMPMAGCEKEDPIEPEPEVYKTEAEMSGYFESAVGGAATRVDRNLRMPTILPPTEDGWVTLNADYEIVGDEHTYLELVSLDDGLNGQENTAIELANNNGLKPTVHRIYSGTADEIDDQLAEIGL